MNEQTVQGVETTETETPQPTNAEVTTETKQEETPEDKRDWRGYSRHLEKENKSLQELVDERKTNQSVATSEPVTEVNTQEEALDLLKNVVGQVIEEKIRPIQEQRVWDEFEKQPYVKALTPEINAELTKIEKQFPNVGLAGQLQLARQAAIAANVDKIAEVHRDIGKDEGYDNKSTKARQEGLGERRSDATSEPAQDILTRSLTMSREDYMKHLPEIRQAQKQQLGLS